VIGGVDRQFPMTRSLPEALDSAAHAILRRWRTAVIESGDGAVFTTLSEVPLSTVTELFVYRDEASRLDWDANGATPENATAMIHLLVSHAALTLVVGNPRERVAAGVLAELEELRFCGDPPRRAA
jgi:hypothetical protein